MTESFNIEKEIGVKNTLVIDSTGFLKGTVDWTRAITLVVTGEAEIVLSRADGSVVKSKNFELPHPVIVQLKKVLVKTKPKRIINFDDQVSHRMILIRDDWTCQYCGKFGDTVDHIFPKSRGGGNTWGNLCCACFSCNNKKDDSTPKEAGLKNPVIPTDYEPKRLTKLQSAIDIILGVKTENKELVFA